MQRTARKRACKVSAEFTWTVIWLPEVLPGTAQASLTRVTLLVILSMMALMMLLRRHLLG
jgi:hypothetical protein